MPLKIAFGTTNLYKGLMGHGIDGIGHYSQELMSYFSSDKSVEITPYSFGCQAIKSQVLSLPAYPQYAIQSILCPKRIASAKPWAFNQFDLIHATDQLMPIRVCKPLIATVMDTIPLTHPHLIPSKIAPIKAFIWKTLTKTATHIITISEFSKQQIIKHMQYSGDRISVIPLGVDERYFERLSDEQIAITLKKFGLPNKFFLHIGTIQPRKNIANLLHAHSQLPFDYPKKYPVVLAGKYAWLAQGQQNIITQAIKDGRCIWIDYVSDLEKRCLLQSSMALTFVSLYEGFGLPIIEAFASKTPVITSANTSLIEVAGDAAKLVDPNSTDEIKDALLGVIHDQGSYNKMIDLALTRAHQFTWQQTALETQRLYAQLSIQL